MSTQDGHEPYVCTLDEASQKRALEELNEDPKNRQGAIDSFREWILQQKHLKCPTDNKFLLAFLRARYFSQLEARQLLENYLRMRVRLSNWTRDLDIGGPELTEAFKTRCQEILICPKYRGILLLPERDKEGRRIMMMRPGYFHQVKNFKKEAVFRMYFCLIDYMCFNDEMMQVNGLVNIADNAKLTLAQHNKVPMDDRRKMMQAWQNNYPIRQKAIHLYNMGTLLDVMLPFVKLILSEKMQKRMVMHGKSLESLYKHVPKELLPDEYLEDDHQGKSAGSEQEIVDGMLAEFSKPEVRERSRYLSRREFTIDMKEKDTDVPAASFRKLNTD